MPPEGTSRAGPATGQSQLRDAGEALSLFAPPLVAGLTADDSHTRHTAGYALFVLASGAETPVEPLAARVVARLSDTDEPEPLFRTLASFRTLDDDAVRAALVAALSRDRVRECYRRIRAVEPWEPPASLSAGAGDPAEFLTEFRRVVRLDETADVDSSRRSDDPTPVKIRERDDARNDDSDDSDTQTRDGNPAPRQGRDSAIQTKRDRIERIADSETFKTIAHRSGFEELDVVAPATQRRYGDVIRARARAEETERGVAIRLLDDPGGVEDAITDRLRSWARLVDPTGTVTVVDWGRTPRPWVATEYVEQTLASRDCPDPAVALAQARVLTGALVQLHQQDIVHGAIDPHNVVYAADTFDTPRPMFDNVGLIDVYRQHFDPSEYLDPRYAAPEYFDDQYGRLGHVTDIYQLGMVVYQLCTGCHPFDGSYSEVRSSILDDRPPAATDCRRELPGALDDVLAKATATQKLTRYETAQALHKDISRVCASFCE